MDFYGRTIIIYLVVLAASGLLLPSLASSAAPTFTTFSQNLQLWDQGPDILALQQWLNANGYPLAQTGPGSPGQETDIFGPHTYRALVQFQAVHGIPSTGFFGPLTRAAINSLNSSAGGSSASTGTDAILSTATNSPTCSAPAGLTCIPGTAIVQPAAPANGYTPGFGGGGGSAAPTSAPDTTPPSLSLTAPSSGATVSGASVALTATASDNVAVANLQFKVDSTDIGSAITSSPYTTTWNSTSVTDGMHTLYAVVEDTSGNYATSSISITVRNNPPVISSISSGTPGQTSATITWTTDESATSQVNYGATTSYGTASSSAGLVMSHSITLSGLTSDTTYHFQVESVDGQGNTATSSDQTVTTPYVGPGDIVSGALGWWGLRGYDAAYSGNAANICLPADSTCANTTISAGNLVIPGSLRTCNNSTVICTIKTFYDQSGNGIDLTQATIANRATLVLDCIGSLPCAQFMASSSQIYTSSVDIAQTQPYTFSVVANRNGNLAAINGLIASNGTDQSLYAAASYAYWDIYDGTSQVGAAASNNNFHAAQTVFNGSSSLLYVDDVSTAAASIGTSSFERYCLPRGTVRILFFNYGIYRGRNLGWRI